MTKKRDFLKQYLKNGKQVGSVRPSSRFLAKKMLEEIDFQNCKAVVELGPGDGVFTRKILDNLPSDSKLLVFELNDTFYNNLKANIQDPRLILIHDSAEKIQDYLHQYNLDKADAVISSLPLAVFSAELRNACLENAHNALKEDGLYVQFQYTLQAKKYITQIFDETKIKFTALNFPPAFVYTCVK